MVLFLIDGCEGIGCDRADRSGPGAVAAQPAYSLSVKLIRLSLDLRSQSRGDQSGHRGEPRASRLSDRCVKKGKVRGRGTIKSERLALYD